MQIRLITLQLYLKIEKKHFSKGKFQIYVISKEVSFGKKLNHTMKYVAFLSVSTLFYASSRFMWYVEMYLIKFSLISQVKKMYIRISETRRDTFFF